jgi:hypothetical protein
MFCANPRAFCINSVKLSAASVVIFLLVTSAAAQTFRGKILGTVTDPNGAVVVGAKVTARNVGTSVERVTTTDSDGNYSIPELPVGIYQVTVEQTGFQSWKAEVDVGVSAEKRVDASIVVASGGELVTVQVEEQVQTTNTNAGRHYPGSGCRRSACKWT